MSITKTITCDGCKLPVVDSGMGAYHFSPYSTSIAEFGIGEPSANVNESYDHYCSPACALREVDRRLTDMWNRRKETLNSIRRMQGKGEGK